MKSILLTGIREMALCETPMPSLQEGTDVLMKIEQVGVCGSDVHYYETGRIGDQIVEFPFALGHPAMPTADRARVILCEPLLSCHHHAALLIA